MSLPNIAAEPLTSRSGETAPSNAYSVDDVTDPLWHMAWVLVFSSTQRTWLPAPPATVCWVHSPTAGPPLAVRHMPSTADTAWVKRPSIVSSRKVDPLSGAPGGIA